MKAGPNTIVDPLKPNGREGAFTLIELLVVVAIIAILASLLIPAIARAKDEGRKAACISNFRQLQLSMHMYIDDNKDHFPINDSGIGIGEIPNWPNWVAGWMMQQDDWPDNTNTYKLIHSFGGIGSYLKDPKVFKCPSDRSVTRIKGVIHQRVRSVAMNEYITGGLDDPNGDPTSYHYETLANIVAHPPVDMGAVMIDTHSDSIASGIFLVEAPFRATWHSCPANRHGGATLSFSDGHVICHRWTDERTRVPVTGQHLNPMMQPNNRDIHWLQERATAVKPNGMIYPSN